jgi:hypothetical protein
MNDNFTSQHAAAAGDATGSTTFHDCAGRCWDLPLTLGRASKVRKVTGVDLANVQNGRLFLDLRCTPEKLANVLWLLCEDAAQAMDPPVTRSQFDDALDGDALDAARRAIANAAVALSPADKRPAFAAALRKMEQAETEAMKAIERWTEEKGDELLAGVDAAINKHLSTPDAEAAS